jgi:hypothetical protein
MLKLEVFSYFVETLLVAVYTHIIIFYFMFIWRCRLADVFAIVSWPVLLTLLINYYCFPCVALKETFPLLRALLNLLKESLGRSKPATNLKTSTLTHCVVFLLYPRLTEPSSIE